LYLQARMTTNMPGERVRKSSARQKQTKATVPCFRKIGGGSPAQNFSLVRLQFLRLAL
jgi:hypothetical protein